MKIEAKCKFEYTDEKSLKEIQPLIHREIMHKIGEEADKQRLLMYNSQEMHSPASPVIQRIETGTVHVLSLMDEMRLLRYLVELGYEEAAEFVANFFHPL